MARRVVHYTAGLFHLDWVYSRAGETLRSDAMKLYAYVRLQGDGTRGITTVHQDDEWRVG